MRSRATDKLLLALAWFCGMLTLATLAYIIGYILWRGLPHIKPPLFELGYTTQNASLMPALWGTILMVALSLVVALPLGLFSAIYLVEYARRGSRLVGLVRTTAQTLSGIPSIVYGLFGSLLFVSRLKFGYSLLAGSLTISIMILPLLMRTAEEALINVPDMLREGAFGLGAGRLRTVFRLVLPASLPGIMAGVILAIGRVVGETAALIYTLGTVAQMPGSLLDSGRTLAIHMYALSSEGLYTDQAYATAVVLLIIVALINALSGLLARKMAKG